MYIMRILSAAKRVINFTNVYDIVFIFIAKSVSVGKQQP